MISDLVTMTPRGIVGNKCLLNDAPKTNRNEQYFETLRSKRVIFTIPRRQSHILEYTTSMLKCLVTSFNRRSLAHWMPLFNFIRAAGGECDYLLFPRITDPDSAGLLESDIDAYTVLRAPIGGDFQFVDADVDRHRREIIDACAAKPYDAVLLGTCVGGPELMLKQWVKPHLPELQFVGLQHGFVQTWSYYESLSESFDRFAVFGPAFAARMAPEFLADVITMSLPQLDVACIRPVGGNGILFALQLDMDCVDVQQLAREIEVSSGKRVVLRPHPEHVRLYDSLRGQFAFSDANEPINHALARADALVTSGSTVAIQALAAKIPTAVFDHLRGREYVEFGVVSIQLNGAEIVRIINEQSTRERKHDIARQLSRYTGQPGTRVLTAYSAMLRALAPAGWRQELARVNRTVLLKEGQITQSTR